MIKKYFTNETPIIKIEADEIIKYDKSREEHLQQLAKKISRETGVPLYSIFSGKYSCRVGNWYKIDNEYYYFKQKESYHEFFNELLGEMISHYFDLESAHYEIAQLKVKNEEQYGVISKNFCDPNHIYHNLSHYICNCDQLSFYKQDLSIIDEIGVLCQTDEEFRLLQNDLKKLFIRNFYNTQSDGDSHNIILKETSEGIRLAPLFDYSYAYVDFNSLHRYIWNIGELNIEDKQTQKLFGNDLVFQQLLYKLMDANMDKFLCDIEASYKVNIPKEQVDHYKRYDKRIKKLVLENRLIK